MAHVEVTHFTMESRQEGLRMSGLQVLLRLLAILSADVSSVPCSSRCANDDLQ